MSKASIQGFNFSNQMTTEEALGFGGGLVSAYTKLERSLVSIPERFVSAITSLERSKTTIPGGFISAITQIERQAADTTEFGGFTSAYTKLERNAFGAI